MTGRIFILLCFLQLSIFAQSDETARQDTSSVIVPATFSPNGDGKEDVLYIKTYNITNYVFELFDPWGELVYKTQDANAGWNGRNKKDKLNDKGTYYYRVNYLDNDKKPQLKTGYLNLK